MCGIVGFLDKSGAMGSDKLGALIKSMTDKVAHRGPDGDGTFVDAESGLALGHRRLAIIDTSPTGAQPMTSADGRWVISFNGEIYNYLEMRRRLDDRATPPHWRGSSDTEVLVEAASAYGFEEMLKQANGMFALSVWDRRERTLYLARDRMGEKPLYYGWQGSTFLFASELKALVAHPAFERRIEPSAVSLYLAHGYVPNPLCIYRGMAQLEPGHYLKVRAAAPAGTAPEKRAYWILPRPAPQPMEEAEAIDELDALLRNAVKLRMRADVPMGAFLSGGIDSSTIVAMMQDQSTDRVRSFSIGFAEDQYDESRHAGEVARHIGTAHTEMHVTAQDALNVVPMLPTMYDEPFADSSQIPTYLLSKLTRQHVTVALSGDGGDELFGGYDRYFKFERIWARRNHALDVLWGPISAIVHTIPQYAWPLMARSASLPMGRKVSALKAREIAIRIATRNKHGLYTRMVQLWPDMIIRRPPLPENPTFLYGGNLDAAADSFAGMGFLDTGSYLPDDVLAKVDRASMAVSLEGRIPLLDHRIVEFAARAPVELKRRGATGKWLLRKVLDRYVPRPLVARPKQGFGIPLEAWLRGPLKEWGESLLYDDSTIVGDLIDVPTARMAWREHQQDYADHSYKLWIVMMLVSWAKAWQPV
ncbi:MAG: asparagine synthase (glutamine-hydrolyzing) [Proteobacteria bacterium]|nr:asparagine synthase (glutamine-hydrolyzing) [Pseudomonadota bacterium]